MEKILEKFTYFSNAGGPLVDFFELEIQRNTWLNSIDEDSAMLILNWVKTPFTLPSLRGIKPEYILETREKGILYTAEVAKRLNSNSIREQIELLYNDKNLQYGVLQGLQKIKSSQSIPFLQKIIHTDNEELLCEIIFALGEIGGTSAAKILSKLKKSKKNLGALLQSYLDEALDKTSN